MILPRLAEQLLLPLGLTFELLLLGFLLRRRSPRAARALAVAGALVLLLASSPMVSTLLARPLEAYYPVVSVADSPAADVIVVLGGALASSLPPRRGPELVDSSDRVLHAARLYRAGKAPLVVASGGVADWAASNTPESDDMAALLVEWGVPEDRIVRERASRTTYENALLTSRILQARGGRTALLVTSALHLRRAVVTFQRAGVEVVPSPTDFGVTRGGRRTMGSLIPSPGALAGTHAALHEWYGLAYYWLRQVT